MMIACLGWGSLIWDEEKNNDKKRGEFNKHLHLDMGKHPKDSWKTNGPCLPIEFARQSGERGLSNRRVTLVIVPGRRPVSTLWVVMKVKNVDEAKKVLAEREGTRTENIGFWTRDSSYGESKDIIGDWADFHRLEAVVWTNLPPNWNGQRVAPKNIEEVISYIQTLPIDEKKGAEEYIRNTHFQISTEYRKQLEESFTQDALTTRNNTRAVDTPQKQGQSTPGSNNQREKPQEQKEGTMQIVDTQKQGQSTPGSNNKEGKRRKYRKYMLTLLPTILAVVILLFEKQIDELTGLPNVGRYIGITLVVVGGVNFWLSFWEGLDNDREKREQDRKKKRDDEIKQSLANSQADCIDYYIKVVQPLTQEYRDLEKKKKHEFFGWQLAILATSASIAIINVVPVHPLDIPWVRVISTIFGGAIAVMTGLTQLLRAQELWVVFGMAYVSLEGEWNKYRQGSGDYKDTDDKERCKKFVEKFEEIRYKIADQSWVIAGKKDLLAPSSQSPSISPSTK